MGGTAHTDVARLLANGLRIETALMKAFATSPASPLTPWTRKTRPTSPTPSS